MTYHWRGGTELWVRKGEHHARQLLICEPLFEEKNRSRRLIMQIMSVLDSASIGSTVPDLPGTGESLRDIATVAVSDWHEAAEAVAGRSGVHYVASFRGGALLDNLGLPVWRFAPETGARLVRDLKRAQLTSGSASPLYAGHALSAAFLADLATAQPAALPSARIVRLTTDPADADIRYDGAPLWRRAEPGEDADLAHALAHDIIDWMASCAAS